MPFQQYNYFPLTVNQSGWIDVEKNCNGFTVTNVGNDNCQVNDQIFYAGVPGVSLGDSRSFGGNENEVYVGRIKVAFAGVGALPQIEIIQKVFVNIGK